MPVDDFILQNMGRKRKIHPTVSSPSQTASQADEDEPVSSDNQTHVANVSDEPDTNSSIMYTPFTQALLYTASDTDGEGIVYRFSEIEEQFEEETADLTIDDEIRLRAARQLALQATLQAIENFLSHVRNLALRETAGEFAGQGYTQLSEKGDRKDDDHAPHA